MKICELSFDDEILGYKKCKMELKNQKKFGGLLILLGTIGAIISIDSIVRGVSHTSRADLANEVADKMHAQATDIFHQGGAQISYK